MPHEKQFFLQRFARTVVLWGIRLYQRTLSPDHGYMKFFYPHGFCRYRPTCSEYAYESIARYGIAQGAVRALWRVMRCNPWSRGGWDPVK